MRLFLYAPVGNSEAVRVVLGIIAFASIIFGNLMALSQTNIKRLLGYSSISHPGYLLVALIALQSGQMSMETVGVYPAGYLFSSLGAFGVVSLMSSPYRGPDAESLYSYRGLFWHRPILSAVMTVMMLSLAGIPMTLGFIGKFYIPGDGRSGASVVADWCGRSGFCHWFVLLPACGGEPLSECAATAEPRCAV